MGGLGLLISSQLGAADAPLGSIRFRVDKRSAGMPREWELDGMSLAAWRSLLAAAKRRLGLASNPNTGVSTSEALYVRIMDVRVLVLVQSPLDRFCRYEMRPERHA
jgi:hypothetical protein